MRDDKDMDAAGCRTKDSSSSSASSASCPPVVGPTVGTLSNGPAGGAGGGGGGGRSGRRTTKAAADYRFRKAVCRVLIALSFKSFRSRNEGYRKRERSDCSEAFFLPVVEEERPSEQDDISDVRRSSSCGGESTTTPSEEEDSEAPAEPSSPLPRRGRRQAICDSKSLGTDGGDLSPMASCDENESSSVVKATDQQPATNNSRRRSSADLELTYPGDLLLSQVVSRKRSTAPLLKRNTIADFANTKAYQESTASLISASDQDKKIKNSFSILKLREKKGHRSKDNLPLSEVLLSLKTSEFKDPRLIAYKDSHWLDLVATSEGCEMATAAAAAAAGDDGAEDAGAAVEKGEEDDAMMRGRRRQINETERKRREAVWELFRSECVFLIDHLMVLKHCFMEPLKKVQVEGHLMFAEPSDLFGNLDELCYVSYTFSRDFISLLLKDGRISDFGRTQVLIKALRRFCQLTRDGEVYHDYCLNYSKAMTYLEQLRKNEDFCEFEKWCGQDERCHRLQLTDLLISPMQHCTKVPLLLNNIRRYTEEMTEQQLLTESLEKLQTSLENLEAKMLWLKNFERVQEIQQQIIWQPITELEPRAFIPEFLRGTLNRQPCERLLSSAKRRLLHEGSVTLLEISKAIDMYMFLFDDILLLTKVKKAPRKRLSAVDQLNSFAKVQTDGAVFLVHRQPIALDRFVIHDVRPSDTSGVFFDYLECSSESYPSEESSDVYKDWCLPHIYDDCGSPSAQKSNSLLFGCVSAATVLKNAFVLVQVNRFQQIIGVYTLQAPTYSGKATWLSRLHEAQELYKDACRKSESKRPSRVDCSAAIDITVQCENGSFLESPAAEDQLQQLRGAAGANASSSSRPPPSSLLGVPRGAYLDAYHHHLHHGALGLREEDDPEDGSPDEGSRNRKIRSCSSDAAAALQRSEEEATAAEEGGGAGFIRRTSDPLCTLHRLMPADTAAAETETKQADHVEPPSCVQIPVPQRRHHQLLGRTTSYTSDSSSTSAGYSTRQPPGYYYAAQPTPTPLSVYGATGGPLHPTQTGALSGLYTTSPFYSGPDCHDAFMNRESRMSLCRRHRRHDDTTTTPITTTSAITQPHHRPQSLLVSHNSRETMTSAPPPPPGVAMATAGTKNSSRLRRATSLRIHRRTQKAAPPSVDSVYI